MLNNLQDKLDGYKTYIVCGAAILTAVAAWLNHSIATDQLITAVFQAVAGITLRAGISKV